MTDADTLERPRETLYITDAELIRRMGVPEKIAREAIAGLDKNPRSGFPQKQELWGNRRYWPAVRAYFDAANRIESAFGAARVAPESRTPHPTAAPIPMRRASQRRDIHD